MLVERGGVALEPALVLEPALDKIERDLRQPPLRHAVQIFDIDGLIDPHARVISWARGKVQPATLRNFASLDNPLWSGAALCAMYTSMQRKQGAGD